MTDTNYGPRTKDMVKNALMIFLYEPALQHYKKKLHAISSKNMLLTHADHNSFRYKGTLYNCENTPAPRQWNMLSKLLYPAMEEYLQEWDAICLTEIPQLDGFIVRVMNRTHNHADWLRIFPEGVRYCLQNFSISYATPPVAMSDEDVQVFKQEHSVPLTMMRERLVMNLLY